MVSLSLIHLRDGWVHGAADKNHSTLVRNVTGLYLVSCNMMLGAKGIANIRIRKRNMSFAAIKQAEKTFRTAICSHAAQFDMTTIHRAELLLFQARAFVNIDPIRSKLLAEDAQRIALEALEKTRTEKSRLKEVYETDVTSLLQEFSRQKTVLDEIQEQINTSTYLTIAQRMDIAEVCIKQVEDGLEKEQFSLFPALYARSRQRLQDVSHILNPVLEQIHYTGPAKAPARRQKVA